MQTLFPANFNWKYYLIFMIIVRLTFQDVTWYQFIALMISVHQFVLLFMGMGNIIPVRYLFGSFMCLQMLVGPTLAYNGLDSYQRGYYVMQVPADVYYAYVLPAVVSFILGLHLFAGRFKGEIVDIKALREFVSRNKMLPYYFIAVGFATTHVRSVFGAELAFVFVILSNFKFVGAFLIILGERQTKPAVLAVVFGSIILSSLTNAMFHDLLTWAIFIAAVLFMRYKPSPNVKLAFASAFVLLALFIQLIKADYREATWAEGEQGGVETLAKTVEKGNKKNNMFSKERVAQSNLRINQGFIVANIMKTVPDRVPFANGEELMLILEAAFLPRVLAPDKLRAGDRTLFTKYSGMPLARGTSMGLSSVGDAYINFGIFGGCIFMFCLGLLYSYSLNLFHKYSGSFPILILLTGVVCYYPIRPDCELQTALGHLLKGSFIIFVMLNVWKYKFRVRRPPGPRTFNVAPY